MRIKVLVVSLMVLVALLVVPNASSAAPSVGVAVSIRVAPPILPVYAQPICPGAGYIWAPGYWAWGVDGYYWVPGLWQLPPSAGLLWTPGYWGFGDGVYLWHAGYWGASVGFYGGINYGFGYPGVGFYGGYWRGGQFFYNTRVMNVNRTVIHNVYEGRVINVRGASHVSFNGGPHGIQARPTERELAVAHERHVAMTSEQMHHEQIARADRANFVSVNHGHPAAPASRVNESNARREEASHPVNASHRVDPSRSAEHTSRPAPERATPERSESRRPAASPKAEASHTERPATHAAAPEHRSAPAHTSEPAHRATPKPEASHTERPASHPTATERRSAPAAKPAATHTEKPASHQPAAEHKSAPSSSHNIAAQHSSSPKPQASHSAPATHAQPAAHATSSHAEPAGKPAERPQH
jgi:hypothetical protein